MQPMSRAKKNANASYAMPVVGAGIGASIAENILRDGIWKNARNAVAAG